MVAGKRFADDEEVKTEVLKWLRQQSKDVYAASFDPLVKRWGEVYQCWWRICRDTIFFFQFRISHILRFISNFWPIYCLFLVNTKFFPVWQNVWNVKIKECSTCKIMYSWQSHHDPTDLLHSSHFQVRYWLIEGKHVVPFSGIRLRHQVWISVKSTRKRDVGTRSQGCKLIQTLEEKSEIWKAKILKSSNTHDPEPNVIDFINALPGNSSVNRSNTQQ
jgi:hypothetical protein